MGSNLPVRDEDHPQEVEGLPRGTSLRQLPRITVGRICMIGTIVRAILAILVIIIAFKLLKGILGLIVGLAIAAVIFVGAKNLLSGGGTKRIK